MRAEMVVFPLVPVTTMVSLGFATYRKKSPYSRIAAMPGLSLRTCPVRQYQNRKNLPPHRAMANRSQCHIFMSPRFPFFVLSLGG